MDFSECSDERMERPIGELVHLTRGSWVRRGGAQGAWGEGCRLIGTPFGLAAKGGVLLQRQRALRQVGRWSFSEG